MQHIGIIGLGFTNPSGYAKLIVMKNKVLSIRKELARFARKIAQDRLVFAKSGNISARLDSRIYIKRAGTSLEEAKASDFVVLNMKNGEIIDKKKASCEYRFHIACYEKNPEAKAVFHTHPLFITTLYSAGIRHKPITLEFALYIKRPIATLPFLSPGSKALADAVKDAAARHDVIIIKKHGLITIGKTMQEAYLKALIIEREARSQVICRLFRKKPPYITDKELASLAYL